MARRRIALAGFVELAGGSRAEALLVSLDPARIDAQAFLL